MLKLRPSDRRYVPLFLFFLIFLLAACTTPEPEAVEGEATAVIEEEATAVVEEVATATPEPKEPTVFRMAIPSDIESLEPGLFIELYVAWVMENLHIGLVRYNEVNEVIPYLAQSWDISDDHLTYTFYLSQDAMWHNGRPIVAADFKKSFERLLDPEIAAPAGPDYLGKIVGAMDIVEGNAEELSGVEVVDDYTLKITTVEPDPGLLQRLATPFTWPVPSEALVEGKAEWTDVPIGGGPFKFVEWRMNEKIVFEAWDDFFQGRPSVDRIEFYIVPESATVLAMYEAGELDIAAVTGPQLQYATENPELSQELVHWTRARLIYFLLNQGKVDAFKDVRVRQAFNYALDKETIIDKILFNSFMVATGFVPSSMPDFNPDLKGYEFDPEKARQLLAEAGYPNGDGFPTLEIVGYSDTILESETFAAQMKEVLNVNIEVSLVERGEYLQGAREKRFDLYRGGWTADFPSAEIWLYQLLHSGSGYARSGYLNPEFDAIVDQAMATWDADERAALWHQAEEIAMEDSPLIPLGYDQYIYLVRPGLTGLDFNFHGPLWLKDIKFAE